MRDTAGHEAVCEVSLQVANTPGYRITSIRTEPLGAMLEPGDSVDFTAIGTDTAGCDHLIEASFAVNGLVASVDASGHLVATALGTGSLLVSYQGFTFEAPISVVNRIGDTVLSEDTIWTAEANPWVVDGWVVVPRGITLTLAPGTAVKFKKGGILVEGALVAGVPPQGMMRAMASGESGVTLTSIADDSVVGDTNADRAASQPQPGDWSGLYYSTETDASLDSVLFSFGGAPTDEAIVGGRHVSGSAELVAANGSTQVTSCSFEQSAGSGIYGEGAITLTNDTFTNNALSAVVAAPGAASITAEGCAFEGGQGGIMSYAEDVTVRGSSMNNTGAWGIRPAATKTMSVSGNTISSVDVGVYIDVRDGLEADVTNNNISGCSRHGVYLSPGGGGNQANVSVTSNTIADCAMGVDLDTANYGSSVVASNEIKRCNIAVTGVLLGNVRINGNEIEDCVSYGVSIFNVGSIDGSLACSSNTITGKDKHDWDAVAMWGYACPATFSANSISGVFCAFSGWGGADPNKPTTIEGSVVSECTRLAQIHGGSLLVRDNSQVKVLTGMWLTGDPSVCNDLDVVDNTFDCPSTIVQAYDFGSVMVQGNTMHNTDPAYTETGHAIHTTNCDMLTAKWNETRGLKHAILSDGDGAVLLEGNTLKGSGAGHGMVFDNESDADIRVLSNLVANFAEGIRIGQTRKSPLLIHNTIEGNASYGLSCYGPGYSDASNNWWGSASGPAPYGTGNAVWGYADVQPWVGQTEYYGKVNGHDPHCSCMGDPVNVNTGNFLQQHTDLSIAGTGPVLEFTRTYNSISVCGGTGLGAGWSHTYSEKIEDYLPLYTENNLMLLEADGSSNRYIPEEGNRWLYHPEDAADQGYAVLARERDGTYSLSRPDGSRKTFDAARNLSSVSDAKGNTLTVTRDAQYRVTCVTDACGQTLGFEYSDGYISAVVDPAGRRVEYTHDASGDLVRASDLNGGSAAYAYDAEHRMLSVTDAEGVTYVRNTYDQAGRVIRQEDGLGHVSEYAYNQGAHTHSFTDNRGFTTVFQDNIRLYQTGETDPANNSASLEYDDAGNVISSTDKRGNTTTYTYDSCGNMLSETDPLGNTTSHTYDERGNCLSTTDPVGNTTSMTYDGGNNLLSSRDPSGNTNHYTNDSMGRKLTSTDPAGNTTTNAYDSRGNLTSVTNPDGGVTTNVYDAANRKTSTTDPCGNTTTFTYDAMGNLLSMTDPLGNTTTYTYDRDGNQVSATDPLSNTATSEYDSMGRLSSTTDPLGNTTSHAYDPNGNKTAEIDPLGNTTRHEYDSLGREVRTVDARGNATSRTYDAEANVLSETDAEGKITSSTYDEAGRLSTSTDALGNVTSYEYDEAGREVALIDPLGNISSSSYDPSGRLTLSADAEGNATTYSYDSRGNRIRETDPDGNATLHSFDSMNREVTTTDPEGRQTSFTYDRNGKKTSVTDPSGATTTLTYDARGVLLSATDPVGSAVSYAYDQAGRRTSMTDAKGAITTYAYDAASRLMSETDPLGQVVVYEYDEAGRPVGRTDGMGTSSFTLDANSNVTAADYPGGLRETASYDRNNRPVFYAGAGTSLSLDYDALGRAVSVNNGFATTDARYDELGNVSAKAVTWQGGTKEYSFSYSSAGRMTEATDDEGRTTSFSYTPAGRLTQKNYPNGVTTDYSYDSSGLVAGLSIDRDENPVKTYSVSRDSRANIASVTEDSVHTTSYSYDAASRLIAESNPFTGNVSYSYDPAGNRLARQKEAEPALTYSYDAGDRLVSDSSGNTYSYNARGDLTRITKGSFQKDLTWDGKGRLVSVTDTEGTDTLFAYDPLNRTLGASENGVVSLKLYDMTSDMEIASLDGSQELKSLLFAGTDGLISQTCGEETSYFSFNPHSDASLITDESGNTEEELHYDAWGRRAEDTEEKNTYLGKHQRPEYHSLGLIKMGARFYDPETGRFISKDPVAGHDEIPASHNRYTYAYNDPVNGRDLSGLDAYSDSLRAQANCLYIQAACDPFMGDVLRSQADMLMYLADQHDKEVAEATRKKQEEEQANGCIDSKSTTIPDYQYRRQPQDWSRYSGNSTWSYRMLVPSWTIHVTAAVTVKGMGSDYALSGWVIARCSQAGDWWFDEEDDVWIFHGTKYEPLFSLTVFFGTVGSESRLGMDEVDKPPEMQARNSLCIDFEASTSTSHGIPRYATASAAFASWRPEGSWGTVKISGSFDSKFKLKRE